MIKVFTPDGSIATFDNGTDWEIDPDRLLTVVDGGLNALGIYNRDAWASVVRINEE